MVAALLTAASLGIWMESAHFNPTPRINASTVGMGIVPIPALAWIVYLWSRTRPRGFFDIAFRIIASVVLVLGSGYCWLVAMIDALFVG
jgi:hypothetical protein